MQMNNLSNAEIFFNATHENNRINDIIIIIIIITSFKSILFLVLNLPLTCYCTSINNFLEQPAIIYSPAFSGNNNPFSEMK